MTLHAVLIAIAVLGATGLAAALAGRSDRAALRIGTVGTLLGCAIGLTASGAALVHGDDLSARAPWTMPFGEIVVGLDPLASFFLVCVFLVCGLAALYGHGYLAAYVGRRRLAPAVSFLALLVASMAGVVVARDGVLFLVAWEAMSIASLLLVTWEHEREEVRRAGMTYLVASQAGVVLLFVLFALLARAAGGFGFDRLAAAGTPTRSLAHVCFLLALVGFGTKAGFWPVHVWLPDAHPAAPSHVSAVMSGVMIKMGIYGLLRVLGFLGAPSPWWGALLVVVGAVSGIAGLLHAVGQRDYKRLLAYSSVENVGIVALGAGIGVLGRSAGAGDVAFLGFAGALLHVLNHGLMKGLLFQGAGSVLHATGTRAMDSLGGLARRMPVTALTFLAGAIAICGLPPLNGFVGEWLLYVGALRAGSALAPGWGLAAMGCVPALALIGGLAAACFVKAYGVVFLGQPRTPVVARAHEAGPAMRGAMIAGAAACVVIGAWPAGAIRLVTAPASALASAGAPPDALGELPSIARVALVLVAVVAALALLRAWLLRGRAVRSDPTWGCGYSAPTPRMQYTAASFAEPLLAPFGDAVHRVVTEHRPAGYFPARGSYDEHLGDMAGERLLLPVVRRFVHALSRLRIIQHGRIQVYLVYLFVALVVLLAWQLWGGA